MVFNACLFTKVRRVLSAEASTIGFKLASRISLTSNKGNVVTCSFSENMMEHGELVGWKFSIDGHPGWTVEIYND